MGRLESNSGIHHFSHEHPLELHIFQPQNTARIMTCSGCKRNASRSVVYVCEICRYCLHKTCANLPQTLTHEVDQEHPLVLLSTPAYPEGKFDCNACGSQGTGFSYHCPSCELDLHPVCAFMPLEINHVSHNHTLSLCFNPPYETSTFSCDICEGMGSNHWLYRCDSCDFDAHMKCAKSTQVVHRSRSLRQTSKPQYYSPPPPSSVFPHIHTQYSFPGNGYSCSGRYGQQVPDQFAYGPQPAMGVPQWAQPKPQPQPSRGNGLVGNVVENIVEGMANQAGQVILAAMLNS